MISDQLSLSDFYDHLHQPILDELIRSDRPFKDLSFLSKGLGCLKAGNGRTQCPASNPIPGVVQTLEDGLEAKGFRKQVFGGNPTIFEDQERGRGGPVRKFFLDPRRLKARRP